MSTRCVQALNSYIGSPFTLGQAQSHISKGSFGPRITWVQNDPVSFLSSRDACESPYDVIVFANSLWYFSSPSQISSTLALAGQHAKRIAVAEYSLHAAPSAHINATPHVYAALAQAALEVRKPKSVSNIRTIVTPKRIISLAAEGKLILVRESMFTPAPDVDDARWETGFVASEEFRKEIDTTLADNARERELALALRETMLAAIADLPEGRKGLQMMDVWCGVFEKYE